MPDIGLACHKDSGRVCGPDCVAYQKTPEGEEYQEEWGHCVELVSNYRTAKHLVLIARMIQDSLDIEKKKEKARQDHDRKEKLVGR